MLLDIICATNNSHSLAIQPKELNFSICLSLFLLVDALCCQGIEVLDYAVLGQSLVLPFMLPHLLLLLFVLIHATLILVVVLVSIVILLIVAVILSFLIILWLLGNDLYRLLCQMVQFFNSVASSLFWVFLFVVSLVVRIVSGFVGFIVDGAYSMVSEHGVWTDYNISNKG